jgi:hypothetical protein
VDLFQWGLVPLWAKDKSLPMAQAVSIFTRFKNKHYHPKTQRLPGPAHRSDALLV